MRLCRLIQILCLLPARVNSRLAIARSVYGIRVSGPSDRFWEFEILGGMWNPGAELVKLVKQVKLVKKEKLVSGLKSLAQ